jgi:hypothetical protein
VSLNASKLFRRRLRAAAVLSLAVAGLTPASALAEPALGGTAPTSGEKERSGNDRSGNDRSGPDDSTPLSTTSGATARLLADGTAQAPASAPEAVKRVIAAGNQIAKLPYRYGGGHALLNDTGYDCSGSVSFALRGGGLFEGAAPSSGFYSYGESGPGRWITVYANGGHMYMVVAGLRFDTSGARQTGSRWQTQPRPATGYIVRHPSGL